MPGPVPQARSSEVRGQCPEGAPILKFVYGDQMLLEELTAFIEEVVKNGGEVSKEAVVAYKNAHEPGSCLTAVYVSALLPLEALSVVTTPYPP
jgi:hypothetical protein